MTAAPLTTEEKRDKGGQRNLPEWKNCLTATRKRVQRVRPRLSSAPVSGQPSLRGRLLGTVFIPISHLRKLRLSMEGGDVPQVIQLGNSRTRAPPTERYHRVPWLWAESCETPFKVSQRLSDSGWRAPVFSVSGKCVGLGYTASWTQENALALVPGLWRLPLLEYKAQVGVPRDPGGIRGSGRGAFAFCTQLCHFCLEPAEPLWHLLFFFFLIHLGPIICFVKNQAL